MVGLQLVSYFEFIFINDMSGMRCDGSAVSQPNAWSLVDPQPITPVSAVSFNLEDRDSRMAFGTSRFKAQTSIGHTQSLLHILGTSQLELLGGYAKSDRAARSSHDKIGRI